MEVRCSPSDLQHVKGSGKCIRVYMALSKGPCHDDWCEPIRKPAALITDGSEHGRGEILLDVDGVCVIMDGELYYSASKLRDRIIIGVGKGGNIKVKGFTAY